MAQITKGAKEQQNNEAIPRTALPRLAVKNNIHWNFQGNLINCLKQKCPFDHLKGKISWRLLVWSNLYNTINANGFWILIQQQNKNSKMKYNLCHLFHKPGIMHIHILFFYETVFCFLVFCQFLNHFVSCFSQMRASEQFAFLKTGSSAFSISVFLHFCGFLQLKFSANVYSFKALSQSKLHSIF